MARPSQATIVDGLVVRGIASPVAYRGQALRDLLTRAAELNPDMRQDFWADGVITSATFAELEQRGQIMARALAALGVGAGDGIAIQMPNWIETSIAYRACFALGAVLTPVVHIYGAAELTFILQQSRARVLVMPAQWRGIDFEERIRALGDCPDLRHVVVVGETTLSGVHSWSQLMRADNPDFARPAVGENDPALLLYTSGTTAAPKGVRHSSRTLMAEVDQRRAHGDVGDATTFSAWPAGHIGGFGSILYPQITGGRSILMDRWVPEDGVRLMSQYGVSRTAGVPVLLNELLDVAARLRADLSSLRGYMTGAANVPPSLVERAAAAGIAVYRAYGSSEHPTVTSSRPEDPLQQRAFTDGVVLAGCEVRLLDDEDRDVAGIGEGEIVTRGEELFCGYQDEALNAEAFIEGGWFRTGDIGRFDNGCLVITDRKKDIIIRGGENISSKEVEDVLARHPAVQEVAVFSVPHERLGEGVAAAVILRPGATLAVADLGPHFAAAGVARQKTPERLEVVRELPRTPSGKVKKYELRRIFGGR